MCRHTRHAQGSHGGDGSLQHGLCNFGKVLLWGSVRTSVPHTRTTNLRGKHSLISAEAHRATMTLPAKRLVSAAIFLKGVYAPEMALDAAQPAR